MREVGTGGSPKVHRRIESEIPAYFAFASGNAVIVPLKWGRMKLDIVKDDPQTAINSIITVISKRDFAVLNIDLSQPYKRVDPHLCTSSDGYVELTYCPNLKQARKGRSRKESTVKISTKVPKGSSLQIAANTWRYTTVVVIWIERIRETTGGR